MNIAVGVPVERGKALGDFNPRDYANSLLAEKFNGYLCLTIAGRHGMEEGILVFHEGTIAAAGYEYFRYNKQLVAEDGLARFLNALLAQTGVMDAFSLTPYQVRLVLTLNEDSILRQPVDGKNVPLVFPQAFSMAYEDALHAESKEDKGRTDLLKKLRLTKLAAPNITRTRLLRSGEKDDEAARSLLESEEQKPNSE